jgi:hypothetical protein
MSPPFYGLLFLALASVGAMRLFHAGKNNFPVLNCGGMIRK